MWRVMRDGHGYTCPVLMHLTRWLTRRARWKQDSGGQWRVVVPVAGHGYEATCLFPRRIIMAECRWWDSRIGVRTRWLFGWK